MTFYRPHIPWVRSWLIAASPGDSLYRSVTIQVATTQAALFAFYTGVSNVSVSGGGAGTYYSSTGTAIGSGIGMDSGVLAGGQRYAASGLIGATSLPPPNTTLAEYLIDGIHYDFVLAGTGVLPNPINAYVSAVLTIVVLSGYSVGTSAALKAALSSPPVYGPIVGTGSSTGSVDVWLDAFYSNQVHTVSAWGAHSSGLPSGNWWQAGEAFQPAVHGLPSVYQSVAVAATDLPSSTAQTSPMTYALDSNAQWTMMAWQGSLEPQGYFPPPTATPARLATIVG